MPCHFVISQQKLLHWRMTVFVESVKCCIAYVMMLFLLLSQSLHLLKHVLFFIHLQVRLWEWIYGSSIRILLNDSKWSIVCFCQHFKQNFFCYDGNKIWNSLFCWLHLWKRRWVIVNFFWSFSSYFQLCMFCFVYFKVCIFIPWHVHR